MTKSPIYRTRLKHELFIPKGAFSWTYGKIERINEVRHYAHEAAFAIDGINRTTSPNHPLLQYLTPYCVECLEFAERDEYHVIYDGFVLICCEDYKQVNPNLIGFEMPDWCDWLECGFCGQLQCNCSCEDKVRIPR